MKVRWGIMGTANIAVWGMIPGMKQASNCELYAIAGRDITKAESFRDRFGFTKAYGTYDELLDDPEVTAVYIPLPNNLHCPWVIKALRKGKHVLCEKPLGLNSTKVRQMFQAAEENNVFLSEAYAYLHSPYIRSLRETVSSGIIGEVDYIETAFITQGYKEDFRLHKELGGGAMYDLGCYCTTMIMSLIDSEPEYVKANAEFSDSGVDLMTSAVMRFCNGARASFNVGMIFGEESNSRFDRLYIHGSEGSIRSDVEYNGSGDVSYRINKGDSVITKEVSVPNNYSLEIEQFGRCILEGGTPLITPEFSIRNSELIDKVLGEIGFYG